MAPFEPFAPPDSGLSASLLAGVCVPPSALLKMCHGPWRPPFIKIRASLSSRSSIMSALTEPPPLPPLALPPALSLPPLASPPPELPPVALPPLALPSIPPDASPPPLPVEPPLVVVVPPSPLLPPLLVPPLLVVTGTHIPP